MRDGKVVAVKVLGREYAQNDDEVQRFVRAIKTMVGLHHPNLVELDGAGKMGDVMWIAMEYVEGENLVKVIRTDGHHRACSTGGMRFEARATSAAAPKPRTKSRSSTATSSRRTSCIRKARQCCEARRPDAGQGALRAVRCNRSPSPARLVGDLAYMSPEGTGSDPSAVDTRSDIYSLAPRSTSS